MATKQPAIRSVDYVDTLTDAKNIGNFYFKKHRFREAIQAYEEGLQVFKIRGVDFTPEETELREKLASNLAQCFLELKEYESCIRACSVALETGPTNKKPLYRRACALEKLRKPREAMRDVLILVKIDPKDKTFRDMATRVSAAIQEEDKIANSFDKYVGELVKDPDVNVKKNISIILTKMSSSPSYHQSVCDSGFLNRLVTIALDQKQSYDNRTHALKGLRSAFAIMNEKPKSNGKMSKSKRRSSDPPKPSPDDAPNGLTDTQLKVGAFEGLIPNLVGLLRYGSGLDEDAKES
eukprot:767507_1